MGFKVGDKLLFVGSDKFVGGFTYGKQYEIEIFSLSNNREIYFCIHSDTDSVMYFKEIFDINDNFRFLKGERREKLDKLNSI